MISSEYFLGAWLLTFITTTTFWLMDRLIKDYNKQIKKLRERKKGGRKVNGGYKEETPEGRELWLQIDSLQSKIEAMKREQEKLRAKIMAIK